MPASARRPDAPNDSVFTVRVQPGTLSEPGRVRASLGDAVDCAHALLTPAQAREMAAALVHAANDLEQARPMADSSSAEPVAELKPLAANEPALELAGQTALGRADEAMLRVYCDGAAKGNPGAGGWGFVVMDEADRVLYEECGGEPHVTNNQMELLAMVRVLLWLDGRAAEVFTDSQYVQKGLTEWLPGWKRNNWRRGRGGGPVKNAELWRELDMLQARSRATINWVRGHNGDVGNERADALANRGALASR